MSIVKPTPSIFKYRKYKCPKCGETKHNFLSFSSTMCKKCQVPMKSNVLNNIMDLLDDIPVVSYFKK